MRTVALHVPEPDASQPGVFALFSVTTATPAASPTRLLPHTIRAALMKLALLMPPGPNNCVKPVAVVAKFTYKRVRWRKFLWRKLEVAVAEVAVNISRGIHTWGFTQHSPSAGCTCYSYPGRTCYSCSHPGLSQPQCPPYLVVDAVAAGGDRHRRATVQVGAAGCGQGERHVQVGGRGLQGIVEVRAQPLDHCRVGHAVVGGRLGRTSVGHHHVDVVVEAGGGIRWGGWGGRGDGPRGCVWGRWWWGRPDRWWGADHVVEGRWRRRLRLVVGRWRRRLVVGRRGGLVGDGNNDGV